MNNNMCNLSFTMIYSSSELHFLDVTIYKEKGGTLASFLYRKATAGNTILHASSAHPQPLIRFIPFSQYLRIRRNCSDDTVFQSEANKLRDRLEIVVIPSPV